jgi:hypothetical protein
MPGPRTLPEVPTMRTIKITVNGQSQTVSSPIDPNELNLLTNMRQQVTQLTARLAIPDPPTNLKATAQAFANFIQFSRSGDADYYEITMALKPNLNDPSVVIKDIGNSNSYSDQIGNVGITKYYWVRARKMTGASSIQVGPVKATTLASATGSNQPNPPAAGNILVLDASTGTLLPYTLSSPRSTRGSS